VDLVYQVVGDAGRLDLLLLPGWVAEPWPRYGVEDL
jgi:hypothetical protein